MFTWKTSLDADAAKSLAGLLKYNAGRFKSEKQRDFLKSKLGTKSHAGLIAESQELFLVISGKVKTTRIDFIYKASPFGLIGKYKVIYYKGSVKGIETLYEVEPETVNPHGIAELGW